MDPGREPRFSDLAKFVDEKSRVASSMYCVDLTKENSQNERASLVRIKMMGSRSQL